MDLQLRKINFVKEFLNINSEEVIDKLEKLLIKEKSELYLSSMKPLTISEFNTLIDKAEIDAKENRVKSARQLSGELASWG